MLLEIDSYLVDVLMPDLTEHEKRPSAFLVYLYLWRHSLAMSQRAVTLSYQQIAADTGLSKSAVQSAVRLLKRRKLISVFLSSPTATPVYRPHRPWSKRKPH
jgi:hypothetical protein